MFVDHRIRKEALIRLITINKKLNPKKELIEKTFIQRYFIKQKYVQVILDASSFNNTKLLRQTMNLPKTIFNDLGGGDHFGFKVFKNNNSCYIDPCQKNDFYTLKPSTSYFQDVLQMEAK